MKKYMPDSTPVLTEKVFVKTPRLFYGGGTGYEVATDENYDVVIAFNFRDEKEFAQRAGRANRYTSTAIRQSCDARKPPQLATFLLNLFLSSTSRDNMIGDLEEQFSKQVELHDIRMASLLYVKDACTMIYSAVFKLLTKILEIAGIQEIIRRIRF